MNKKLKNEFVDILIQALLLIKNEDECMNFLDDILTATEIQDIAQRLEVAIMLRNKETYQEICEKTGASTATISRVNRCLIYGADGYNTILDKLEQKQTRIKE